MLIRELQAYSKIVYVGCDEKCNKAFGISNRPKIQLSDDEDDYAFLSDDEVGIAPINPGAYEGSHAKPKNDSEKMNKWCFRECERCDHADLIGDIKIPDYSVRQYNVLRE